MIIFKKLRYKNLLGSGNSPIEIQLNRSKTTLVIGPNGSGKSSGFLDGMTFCLFGKPFRNIKKSQLVNTINGKQCLVEVWFSIGKKEYYIKRGIKPDIFEIYCDEKLIDQVADVREYQRMLEEQILHMNFRTFNQVVILSVANFRPFMQLEAKDRREIIEDILDIRVFSAMNQVLKEMVATNKESIRAIDGNIEVIRQKIEVQKSYIKTLSIDKESKQNEITESIEDSTNKINELEKTVSTFDEEIHTLTESIPDDSEITKKKAKLQSIPMQLKARLKKLTEDINFYNDTDICPTCSQGIDDAIKELRVKEKQDKITEIKGAIEKLNVQLAEIEERENELSAIKAKIRVAMNKSQSLNSEIIAEQTYIKRLNNELAILLKSDKNIESEQEKLRDLTEGSLNYVRQKSELSAKKQNLDIATTLLKDSGIKTRIIEQYLPVVNKLINKYLDVMGIWVSFHLDGEFNEVIKSRHRDTFTYSSFSEGEKQRIDLAILFTWRTISKMKNSVSTNLLVFDEILDKAIDTEGTEQLVNLLDTLGDGSNVFVISHKVAELQDKFRSLIKFEKINNFSQIV